MKCHNIAVKLNTILGNKSASDFTLDEAVNLIKEALSLPLTGDPSLTSLLLCNILTKSGFLYPEQLIFTLHQEKLPMPWPVMQKRTTNEDVLTPNETLHMSKLRSPSNGSVYIKSKLDKPFTKMTFYYTAKAGDKVTLASKIHHHDIEGINSDGFSFQEFYEWCFDNNLHKLSDIIETISDVFSWLDTLTNNTKAVFRIIELLIQHEYHRHGQILGILKDISIFLPEELKNSLAPSISTSNKTVGFTLYSLKKMRSYINESEFFDIHHYLYSVCERTLISPQALKDKSPLPPEFISTLKELYLHFSSSDEYSDPQPSRLNIRLLLTKDKDISLCDRKSALSQLFISSENEIISPLRTKKELELALSICQLTPRAAMLYAQNEKLKSLISEHLVESM
tara:strand:+ start:457 stop:1644 length:1188 start_codon:yes stop_codon:yes gene_type:complete